MLIFSVYPLNKNTPMRTCIGVTGNKREGDRRKPREQRRNPRSRRVGGAGKPSVLHPDPQRRRQAVEHMHQAVERRHALPQADPRRPEEAP